MKIVKDKKYGFMTYFNEYTGEYMRMYDGFQASYPHLIDIGVMGSCVHGQTGLCLKAGIQCYQNGLKDKKPNMSFSNYKKIIDESKGKLFEVALGGRGDVDMHEDFEEILSYTRKNGIIPNFTTSGLGMTKEKAEVCKKYCGAVAVSMYSRLKEPELAFKIATNPIVYKREEDIPVKFTFGNIFPECYWDAPSYFIDNKEYGWDELHHMCYSDKPQKYQFFKIYNEAREENNYTMKAIKMLLDAGVKTNIHFVLSNSTIDEAIVRLKYNGFPNGINAVVFLLHKPVGLGSSTEVLQYNDKRLVEFFNLIEEKHPFKIGFDSCTIPGIINFCKNIKMESVDTCEGGRFSMYIDAEMNAMPCSFDNQEKRFAVSLKNNTIQKAWDSKKFEAFRYSLKHSCINCEKREFCMGGCPIKNEIVLCNNEKRDFKGV